MPVIVLRNTHKRSPNPKTINAEFRVCLDVLDLDGFGENARSLQQHHCVSEFVVAQRWHRTTIQLIEPARGESIHVGGGPVTPASRLHDWLTGCVPLPPAAIALGGLACPRERA